MCVQEKIGGNYIVAWYILLLQIYLLYLFFRSFFNIIPFFVLIVLVDNLMFFVMIFLVF